MSEAFDAGADGMQRTPPSASYTIEQVRGKMTEDPHPNSGEPWSDAAVRALRRCVALGDPLEDVASFLCRSEQDVRAKAAELQLRLPWTDEDDRALKAELEAGRSIHDAALRLTRSQYDVERRLRELGFSDRFLGSSDHGDAAE